TFNTPVGAAPDKQCGRVLYSDFHVNDAASYTLTFPTECDASPMTAQERALEFMIFDLASCIQEDKPTPKCVPATCQTAQAECGLIGDGCGGTVDCKQCAPPQVCGGGGPSKCGGTGCTPTTCALLDVACGMAGDGCGGALNCGECVAPATCGGGGMPSKCGVPTCTKTKTSCAADDCGTFGDGCGGTI